MSEKEWIEIGTVIGDTGPKGDTGDIGIGTVIKGHYNNYSEFITVHPSGRIGDAYIVDGSYYYWNENGWANAGSVRGEKGDTGASVTIKGSYDSYNDLIREHPTGSDGDSYIVNGSLYVWDGTSWVNVGEIKGKKGDTGVKGDTRAVGPKGDSGFSPTVNVNHQTREIVIVSEDSSMIISFDELKGETGPQGVKGDTGDTCVKGYTGMKGDTGAKGDTGSQGLKGDTGAKGDTGPKGDTGIGSDEESGWKLPVNKIQTTTTLPTGVSKGYRVAICTSSMLAIKEYNGSSWDTENLDAYSVIPLKHNGSIQMYLAKASGPVYMGVDYGVFGKFRFMTQAAYDALSSYDEDTIYFVRS